MDADLVGSPDTRWSTLSYDAFLSDNLVSWSFKHQNIVSRSSVEADYRVMANSVAAACWLQQLL
jgi:hypothetical protein